MGALFDVDDLTEAHWQHPIRFVDELFGTSGFMPEAHECPCPGITVRIRRERREGRCWVTRRILGG